VKVKWLVSQVGEASVASEKVGNKARVTRRVVFHRSASHALSTGPSLLCSVTTRSLLGLCTLACVAKLGEVTIAHCPVN